LSYFETWQVVAGELFWFKVAALAVAAFLLTHIYVGPDDDPPSFV
jgi:hypothetical protein